MTKKLLLAFAGAVLIYSAAFVKARPVILRGEVDFAGFYNAGTIVVQGNAHRLYDWELQRRSQQHITDRLLNRTFPLAFNHAPFEALLFAAFALLPYTTAVVIWYAVNVVALNLTLWFLRPRLPGLQRHYHWVVLGSGFFLPIIWTLAQGQDSILLLLLFSASFLAMEDGHDTLGGCILALGTFKPHVILPLVLCVLAARKWKFILGFAATCMALTVISVSVMGWRVLLDYPRFLILQFAQLSTGNGVNPMYMPNVRGFLFLCWQALRLPPAALYPVVGVVSMLLLLLALRAWSKRQVTAASFRLRFSLALAVTMLIVFQTYDYELAILELALLLAVDYVTQSWRRTLPQAIMVFSMVALFLVQHLAENTPPLACVPVLVFMLATARELKAVEAAAAETASQGFGTSESVAQTGG